jgi:hypothetical protein
MRVVAPSLFLALLLGACAEPELIDVDGDGYFANAENPVDQDCDDLDAAMYPTNTEICDGLDNDCNGDIDDDAEGAIEWFPDRDRDGYGYGTPDTEPVLSCVRPDAHATSRDDCNDNDGAIHPNALERCNDLDDNCDLVPDDGVLKDAEWFLDRDRDGYGGGEMVGEGCQLDPEWVRTDSDCNDVVDAINPNAREVCDSADNDCDGLVDGADPDVSGARTYFIDEDEDGYGNVLGGFVSCTRPDGFVENFDDCNDADDDQNPTTTWYIDLDRDGFGVPGTTWPHRQCWQPIGYSINAYDCDDADPESWGTRPWFPDADRDGYGGPQVVGYGCVPRVGWVREPTDCDDRVAVLSPDQQEVCDGIDNDCDGLTDVNDPDADGVGIFYPDADGDGYGLNFLPILECFAPDGYADNADDCNDTNPIFNPGAMWFPDTDRDGDGDGTQAGISSCTAVPGRTPNGDDCDDNDFNYNASSKWYTDDDGDGLGVGIVPEVTGCVADTTGLSRTSGDCDDDDAGDVTGGCYGEQLGQIAVNLTPDNDSLRTGIQVRCQGAGFVIDRETTPANANTPVTTRAQVAPGLNCQLLLTAFSIGDPSSDGLLEAEVVVCGVPFGTYSAPVSGTFTSPTFVSTACSGCLDPLASNYDPTKIVDNNACIYD